MELLGESMSMLRVSPDAIDGVPLARCVAVGLETLDCIEAFHSMGYVHRDIKASNFALTQPKAGASGKRYGELISFIVCHFHVVPDIFILVDTIY
jgi:serine/threonine protein kinase